MPNASIGYATYQQQYSFGDGDNNLASIILFFSIIFLVATSFVIYFWFTEWHKVPPQQRREVRLKHQKEIDQLVENIKQQVAVVFRIPVFRLAAALWTRRHRQNSSHVAAGLASNPLPVSREHLKVLDQKKYHFLSIIFATTAVVAIIILIGISSTPVTSNTSSVLQASLFVFVLCSNLFLITQQRIYYKERKSLFGNDNAHINAVYKTSFDDWNPKIWSNWVQIVILVIEFFQLLTFPLRDLITINMFSASDTLSESDTESNFARLVSIIMTAGGLMPDMRTPTWYIWSLWTALVSGFISVCVAVVVNWINTRKPYKISTRWVHWCIPIATLLYIPVLTTFVSSAACQSLNVSTNDFAVTLRCHAPHISQQMYLWLSLAGYVIAYFLLTIFLTSYERIPEQNEIAFKSTGVAFIKNMGLLLANVSLLVESTTNKNRIRAILSICILLTMVCYNIKMRPCYVDKINFFRTASFCCILWTSVLVAVLSDTNAAQSLGPLTVLCVIVGGWGCIIILFLLVYFCYYKRPADYAEDTPFYTMMDQHTKPELTNFCHAYNSSVQHNFPLSLMTRPTGSFNDQHVMVSGNMQMDISFQDMPHGKECHTASQQVLNEYHVPLDQHASSDQATPQCSASIRSQGINKERSETGWLDWAARWLK